MHEHRTAADAASVEPHQREALKALDPRSSLALRMRARLAAESDYRAVRPDTILPLVREARHADDHTALSEALSLAHHCLLGPQDAELRLRMAEELLRVGSGIAVGKAIRRAVDRITAADPLLGNHLRTTVQTGTRCSYQP